MKRFLIAEEDLKTAIMALKGFNIMLKAQKRKPKITTEHWEECAKNIQKQMTPGNRIYTKW